MSREKQGYRDTLLSLNEMFPDKGTLNRAEVAKFLGVHRTTVYRRRIPFNKETGRITKADLASRICI